MTARPQTAADFRRMGQMHRLKNDMRSAVMCLQRAVALDKNDHESHALLTHIFSAAGDVRNAILHAMLAEIAQPENIAYKKNFIRVAGPVPFTQYGEAAAQVLLRCLQEPAVDVGSAQALWFSLFRQHPAFADIYRSCDFSRLETLAQPFFLRGLERLMVSDSGFEAFLTALRRHLLLTAAETPESTSLAAALACYAFSTEYIFDVSAEEEAAVQNLREAVAAAPTRHQTVLLACYASLSTLKNADAVLEVVEDLPLAETQLREAARLARRRQKLESLTPIRDGVSAAVREQYEEFPYPRWHSIEKGRFDADIRQLLPTRPQVLVAGCGMGKEVISLALALPEAQILAVDLSLTSLAYAAEKAEQHGVRNITFRQGDILNLDTLDKRFDYVTSMGVLHHMQDPLAGWRVLAGLLQPSGIMAIGLYSRLGRPDVAAARAAIAREGISADTAGIRRFRRECRTLLPADMAALLRQRRDYYSLSACRDLVFHVQEHCFDIPQIAAALDTLGLGFIRFKTPAGQRAAYARENPQDPEGRDLRRFAAFEEKNPMTFAKMYKFWCRKS